jgi:transcriptional regulator with XRE-family HTH domain
MKSNLGQALKRIMERNGMTQLDLCTRMKMRQATISDMINKGLRPREDTLNTLCHSFQTEQENHELLLAHLCDEVIRAGWPGVSVSVDAQDVHHRDAVGTIAVHYADDDNVRGVVDYLSEMCKRLDRKAELAMVADSKGVYKTKRDS